VVINASEQGSHAQRFSAEHCHGLYQLRGSGNGRFLGPSVHPSESAKRVSSLCKSTGSCRHDPLPSPLPSHSVIGMAGARKTSYDLMPAPSSNIRMPFSRLAICFRVRNPNCVPQIRPASDFAHLSSSRFHLFYFFFFLHLPFSCPPSHFFPPSSPSSPRLYSCIARHLLASHSFVAVVASTTSAAITAFSCSSHYPETASRRLAPSIVSTAAPTD
jgi:hypothetical protein